MIGTFDHNVASPGGPAQGGPRLSVLGLIASLLWPVTVAVALKWLMMVDDDALMF